MSRGQTLPAWFTSTLLTLIFALLLSSYGQLVAFQFRAQSAADSAAAAIVGQQSQSFNQMIVALHASNVEEFRLRQLLEAIRITASQNGGCRISGTCNDVWHNLVSGYRRSLSRYSDDVSMLSRITATMNMKNEKLDALALVDKFNRGCTEVNQRIRGLDCGNADAMIRYHVVDVQPRMNYRIQNNYADSQSQYTDLTEWTLAKITSVANPDVFAPVAVEVAVCVDLPPLLKTWPFKNSKIVARSAATDVMRTYENFDIGAAVNPLNGLPFQSLEQYGSPSPDGTNWYNVDFHGNPIQFITENGQTRRYTHFDDDYFQLETGWWGSMPIAPFSGPVTAGAINAKLGGDC